MERPKLGTVEEKSLHTDLSQRSVKQPTLSAGVGGERRTDMPCHLDSGEVFAPCLRTEQDVPMTTGTRNPDAWLALIQASEDAYLGLQRSQHTTFSLPPRQGLACGPPSRPVSFSPVRRSPRLTDSFDSEGRVAVFGAAAVKTTADSSSRRSHINITSM